MNNKKSFSGSPKQTVELDNIKQAAALFSCLSDEQKEAVIKLVKRLLWNK